MTLPLLAAGHGQEPSGRSASVGAPDTSRRTSDYWKPVSYLLDDGDDVLLVNVASVRDLPGRKYVSEATCPADLGARGLVMASSCEDAF